MSSELVILKDNSWLENQIHAGKCVSSIFKKCSYAISNIDNLSLIDLEKIAIWTLKEYDCTATFLNYEGFPSAVCASVNKALVHGIVTDYVLQLGDVVSIDVGATYKGAIADAARTWIYGPAKCKQHEELLKVGKLALKAGQDAVKIGNRLGSIGNAINKLVSKSGFGLITDYGGHGLNLNIPHAQPFVANKQSSNSGIRITAGLSIAIEPMVVIGSTKTKVGDDKNTVFTEDIGCHFENSVTVMEDAIYIITESEDEN